MQSQEERKAEARPRQCLGRAPRRQSAKAMEPLAGEQGWVNREPVRRARSRTGFLRTRLCRGAGGRAEPVAAPAVWRSTQTAGWALRQRIDPGAKSPWAG